MFPRLSKGVKCSNTEIPEDGVNSDLPTLKYSQRATMEVDSEKNSAKSQ